MRIVTKKKDRLKYRRVLLKLSGEALGNRRTGECLDPEHLAYMAARVAKIRKLGCEVGIVVGGGNIFRGLSGIGKGFGRVAGDSMGMLATMVNSIAMAEALEAVGVPALVMSAVEMPKIAETFSARRAVECLSSGRVAVFGGGTGNPFFSTDSAAALKACETGADALLKATKVDGVYTADPAKDPSAVKFDRLSYATAIEKRLNVMDAAAFAICRDNSMPIVVFDFFDAKALEGVVAGKSVGTTVCD